MNDNRYTQLYTRLVADASLWARQAGTIQLQYFRSRHLDVRTKLNESDIVTKADRESDALLLECIHSAYPSHSVLSEESGDIEEGGDFRWVIDPLDGTTNYTAGLPVFAVSIGLEHEGKRVGGVVYAPYLNELFTAVRGEGALLNGRPISVRENTLIERAVVATGFPVFKDSNPDNNAAVFGRIMPRVRGIRRLGAASIDICYTAAGILDAYWEMNLHEWDVNAALTILEEAGGRWTDYRPDHNRSVLVASADMFETMKQLVGDGR